MNESVNLVKILKDCPKGTKFYTTVWGEVEFDYMVKESDYPIHIKARYDSRTLNTLRNDGRLSSAIEAECIIFPSRQQRDWSKFTAPWYKKDKFDPKELKPFDKVLVRDNRLRYWVIQLFSHIIEGELNYPYLCVNNSYKYCIPYNDDTKHLVGTTEEAPEFYRYWED